MPQGPRSANRIPILKRAVVLPLNWHAELSFAIGIRVHVNGRTLVDTALPQLSQEI